VGAVLRVLAAAVGVLPWRSLRLGGAALGWLAGTVLRIRRTHVLAAMRAADVSPAASAAASMYASLGTSALEFLWMASRGLPECVAIEPRSEALWSQARAAGRGVVVAGSHTGNWDLAACAMARRGELLVVTKRLSVASLDRFWQDTRARLGLRLAPPQGALAKGLAILRSGGAVAMMIDQAPGSVRHAVPTRFLGRPAWADRSPAALAALAGAPLVVAACRRNRSGGHELRVLDVRWPPPRPARAWIDDTTAAATRALDAFVRAHPGQWLWLHRRWKSLGVDPGLCASTLPSPC